MCVYMIDGLPAVAAGIEDHPVAGIGNTFGLRHLVGLRGDLSQQTGVTSQRSQVGVVLLRDHQHVNRRLRINVAKCKRPGAFQHDRCWYFAGRDSAE